MIRYFKLVLIALVVAFIFGYVLEQRRVPVYSSKMVVKPYFNSKYQLASNINYFNSLIGSRNLKELSRVFEIDTTAASELVGFDLEPGPETQNDLFIEYDEYLKSIDTSLVNQLSYTEFVKNRDLLSGSLFSVKAKSFKNDIFQDLNTGFRKTFENEFSKQQKKIRDTMVFIERETLLKQLTRLDSIQTTYLKVIKNESEKSKVSLGLGNMLPLQEEKTATKEYEIFQKEQEIGRTLTRLNQTIAEENTYYDVLSGFDNVGIVDKSIWQRHSILFPLLTLIGLYILFLVIKVFNFIKNYE